MNVHVLVMELTSLLMLITFASHNKAGAAGKEQKRETKQEFSRFDESRHTDSGRDGRRCIGQKMETNDPLWSKRYQPTQSCDNQDRNYEGWRRRWPSGLQMEAWDSMWGQDETV